MLLFKKNIVFFSLNNKKIVFCVIRFVYYFIKSKFTPANLLLSLRQAQINTLKLNQDYKLKLITVSLKDLDTFILLLLEKLNFFKINFKLSYLPSKSNITTLLRAPFVHKKSQDQLIKIKYTVILFLYCDIYNYFYQSYLEFLLKNSTSFLSKIQYNEIFL